MSLERPEVKNPGPVRRGWSGVHRDAEVLHRRVCVLQDESGRWARLGVILVRRVATAGKSLENS